MNVYKLVLSEIEIACGVKESDVQRELPRALLRNGRVIVAKDVGPALAGAVARCALAGPVEFLGLNTLGQSVYTKV